MSTSTPLIAVVALGIGFLIGMATPIPGMVAARYEQAAVQKENQELRQVNQALQQQIAELSRGASHAPLPLKDAVEQHLRTLLSWPAGGQVTSAVMLDHENLEFRLDDGGWVRVADLLAMTTHARDAEEVGVCEVKARVAGPAGAAPSKVTFIWIVTRDAGVYQAREPIPVDRLRYGDTREPFIEAPAPKKVPAAV